LEPLPLQVIAAGDVAVGLHELRAEAAQEREEVLDPTFVVFTPPQLLKDGIHKADERAAGGAGRFSAETLRP
jgi:hypothetical protein